MYMYIHIYIYIHIHTYISLEIGKITTYFYNLKFHVSNHIANDVILLKIF